MDKKQYINSCMNYTGSKFKLLEQILPKFDYTKNNFVDLFTGSGVIYTNVANKYNNIIVNDIIEDLINIHKELIYNKEEFIQHVIDISPNNKEEYLILRDNYNKEKTAIKLYALMLSCQNNMMRFNQKLFFNQTYGDRKINKNTLIKIDNYVNTIYQYKDKIDFNFKHFNNIKIKEDTFYYIDPPYTNTEAGYNAYWKKTDDELLYNYILNIDKIGSTFMISGVLIHNNKESLLLKKLINDKFHYENIICDYNKVSRKGIKNDTTEIIIKNY